MIQLHDIRYAIGARILFEDLTWVLAPGDRVALVGPNGAGKSTLLKALVGERPPDAGELKVGNSITKKTVAAGKTRVWITKAKNRSVVKLTLGSQLLAEQRVPKACPRPDLLPATGLRVSA